MPRRHRRSQNELLDASGLHRHFKPVTGRPGKQPLGYPVIALGPLSPFWLGPVTDPYGMPIRQPFLVLPCPQDVAPMHENIAHFWKDVNKLATVAYK